MGFYFFGFLDSLFLFLARVKSFTFEHGLKMDQEQKLGSGAKVGNYAKKKKIDDTLALTISSKNSFFDHGRLK